MSEEGFELSPQQARVFRWNQQDARARLQMRMSSKTDLSHVERCLRALVERHEILRTRYRAVEGLSMPLQVIDAEARIAWGDRTLPAAHVQARADALSDHAWAVTLELPALHADKASLRRLARELRARCQGEQEVEEPLQYADYAAWRSARVADDHEARERWQREIAARVPVTVMPLRGAWSPRASALASVELAPTGKINETTLLSAWIALLHRHTQAEQLTIGLDWQNRDERTTHALGLFAEPLPLTVRGLDEQSARALEQQVRERVAWLCDFRDTFPSSEDERPYAFGYRYVADADEDVAESTAAPFVLLLEYEAGAKPRVRLHFAVELYDSGAAKLLLDQLLMLSEEIVRQPERPLQALSAVSSQEQQELERSSRADALSPERERTFAAVSAYSNLVACFEQQLSAQASRIAVMGVSGALTYKQLGDRVTQLAAAMVACGRPRRIAHFLRREPEAIAAMLGILKAGASYVPIDPEYPGERIEYMLQDCGAQLIVTQRELVARLPEAWRDASKLLVVDDVRDAAVPASWPEPRREDCAYVIYTSGSTGKPRGVPITHEGALYSLAARVAYYPEPIGAFLLLSSFAFDSSIAGLFGTLAQGGMLYVCNEQEQRDPAALARVIESSRITHLLALPSLYQLILDRIAGLPLQLRAAIVAGEACQRALINKHHATVPAVQLYNEYGATEASVWSTVGVLEAGGAERPVSVGRPIPHSRLYVLDDADRPVARGMRGEICVSSPGLSPGYLDRPELTREKFVTLRGERVYRTGDYGYWDERGELVFLGRADGQVKIRGYRIELGEIEAALARVTGADHVVVLVDHAREAEPFLRGFVEAEAIDVEGVRAALGAILPAPMLPSDLQALAKLPLNANGKLDRRALLALKPTLQRPAYRPPLEAAERTLAQVWQELLGVERVGLDDDFFALGGHSLLAVKLVHRSEQELGVSLSLSRVFERSRLADMAQLAREAAPADLQRVRGPSSILPLRATGSLAPLYCVDPTGFHISAYQPLTAALDPARPLWGATFDPEAAAAGLAATDSLTRVFDAWAELIAERGPGPYRLLGWSLGGALALGLAAALERRGERVSFVGLVDSQAQVDVYRDAEPDVLEELAAHVDDDRRDAFWAVPGDELSALRSRLQALHDSERIRAAVAWAQERELIRDQHDPATFLARYALLRSAARHVNELVHTRLHAPLHVFWCAETLARRGRPPIEYQAYTRGPTAVHTLAAGHHAALQSAELHAYLNASLRAEVSR